MNDYDVGFIDYREGPGKGAYNCLILSATTIESIVEYMKRYPCEIVSISLRDNK